MIAVASFSWRSFPRHDPKLVGQWIAEDYWPQYSLNADGTGHFYVHHGGAPLRWWMSGDRLVIHINSQSGKDDLVAIAGQLWRRLRGKPADWMFSSEGLERLDSDRLVLTDENGGRRILQRVVHD